MWKAKVMNQRGRRIYVETLIRVPAEDPAGPDAMGRVWALTQNPVDHARWDLRFSRITPKRHSPAAAACLHRRSAAADEAAAQAAEFTYSTTVLPRLSRWFPRLAVSGQGINAGQRLRSEGGALSALRFSSQQWWCPIRSGSGYWKYQLRSDGAVIFLTGYDYEPRGGTPGRLLDAAVFRPLFGWATAWSFDRLRLWAEQGLSPESTRRRAVREALLRGGVVVLAWRINPLAGIAATAAALIIPPGAGTPSARRTRRRPRQPVRDPELLQRLPRLRQPSRPTEQEQP